MGREVHEVAEGLSAVFARQFVGETCGLFRQNDHPDGDGDGITADGTVGDITTEPDADGYERLVLKNGENPTFDVDGYVGTLDHLFFVNDDGDLLAAFPLLDGDEAVVVHDHMGELTPDVWGDSGA